MADDASADTSPSHGTGTLTVVTITASRAAIGGAAAAAAALGVSELLAGLLPGATSLVAAVGQVVIDLQPPGAKDFVVALFGTNDKLALEVLIVVAVPRLRGRPRGRRRAPVRGRRRSGSARSGSSVSSPRSATRWPSPAIVAVPRPPRSGSGSGSSAGSWHPTARQPPSRPAAAAGSMPDWSRRSFLIRTGVVGVGGRRRGHRRVARLLERPARPPTGSGAAAPAGDRARPDPGPDGDLAPSIAGLTPIVDAQRPLLSDRHGAPHPDRRHRDVDAAHPRAGRPRDDPHLGRAPRRCRCSSST